MNSYWIESCKIENKKEMLKQDLEADVCIIGAGILGITTGYYLTKRGLKVVILEKDHIAEKATGHTTAKITSQHGLIYHYLIDTFGKEFAKAYLDANEQAIHNIKGIIKEEKIECEFEKQDNYVYTVNQDEVEKIKDEKKAMEKLGFQAEYVTETNLPLSILAALKFPNQAQFHPRKYLLGLYQFIIKHGGEFYTNTECYDIKKENDMYITYTKENKVKSKYVVIASHYPFINMPGFYFAKMYQSSSYVLGIDTKTEKLNGMYINITSPIYSFRNAKDGDKNILLLGGAGHKTGECIDEEQTYDLLEKKAKELYPKCEILYRWSTRDCITLDKIPYIGQFSKFMPDVYIGTGFNKWGMTSSNVAANIIVDKICKKENHFCDIFFARRMDPIVNKDEVKNMVSQTAKSLVYERMKEENIELEDIQNNSGGMIDRGGQKVGIYKDGNGKVFAVKPVCTHLGCMLSWNDADKTWDCPCHGSRFDYTGKNLYDPAIKDLEKISLD